MSKKLKIFWSGKTNFQPKELQKENRENKRKLIFVKTFLVSYTWTLSFTLRGSNKCSAQWHLDTMSWSPEKLKKTRKCKWLKRKRNNFPRGMIMRLKISLFGSTRILKTMVLAFKFPKKNYFQYRIYVQIII